MHSEPRWVWTSVSVGLGLAIGCGGHAHRDGASADGGSAGTSSSRAGAGGAAGFDAGGAAGSPVVTPEDLIRPRLPEMPPTVVDNPTGTRLIQLWISDSVYALFEDGTVYHWAYTANDSLAITQLPPEVYQGFGRPSQIDRDSLLYPDGTVRWWLFGANGRALTQVVEGVDHAVFASDDCALIRDGSVRCWGASPGMLYINDPPQYPANSVDVPVAVELDSSLNSRCTLVRDAQGAVTRFRPARQSDGFVASDVAALSLPSPAVRLFDGCAMPKTGDPRCVFAPGGMWDMIQTTCADTPQYDVTTPGGEHLSLVSLGGDLRGVALGDSGTVYATLDLPDPSVSTLTMKPLLGVGPASFVRAGVYVSCAVESPVIKCWPHEGRNAYVPAPVEW